ncbi:MAG: tRNA uridine-5-carboxymethylaminomethyl(34) synthesis enzyme MnmG [Bacteroidota bacterium]|nr:tRNA uridine-5-carboxymethylaminomethyl(34) synthesis enzyme MnmG [Bacteroidota bacterium]MEC8614986.1 tRNA uridine-5-carboxymethylaminomethyl(34) synthesis enzyme MnmG [Bacteroidota bacterium]|tara:strand:+ start:1420 stop:3291 length:1872 start_codon:yes stop_codon:yes gene_type:complete
MFNYKFDVIVVGGGHAGAEAAAAASNLGSKTLLITMNLQNIAQMSCNPAMGGIAKGQIVREIDALGGYSGIVSDKSAIQFKMLNKSKGPAMWSPRVQSDRVMFSNCWRNILEGLPNLSLFQDIVVDLIFEGNKISGVITSLGTKIYSTSVILTNGTFLNGLIHIGERNFSGGRSGEKSSVGLTKVLINKGFSSGRMKTGTPPRVDGRSLNFNKMTEQPGDVNPSKFSFCESTKELVKQKSCFITYTDEKVHDKLKEGFSRSPMFNGAIKSVGPRYCPSIEDKINRFSEKERHQIFVEPEGWNTIEHYVNGFSTSLPAEIQYDALKKVKGFEKVKFLRPGYAIEYDYFHPTQLEATLQTKLIKGLFFAGQINGTTGYEEAAAQGLIAGINSHRFVNELSGFTLGRSEAYIGVLIDDLITKGTEEPYRMFTSRAEFRTILRQDNADIRLTNKSNSIGLANDNRLEKVSEKVKKANALITFYKKSSVLPEEINHILKNKNSAKIDQSQKLYKIYSRPNIFLEDLIAINKVSNYIKENRLDKEILEYAEIETKYSGYIKKEIENAEKLKRLENIRIPKHFDYGSLPSLSFEAKEKLIKIKPSSISQASRISGIKPSDVSVILVKLGR